MFADVTAVIADGIRDVEGEVRTASFDGNVHQFAVLLLRKVLRQIDVTSTAAIEIAGEFVAVKDELVDHICLLVLNDIEIAVVAVARNLVSIALVP